MTLRVGDFDFVIGQQIATWGILDVINVVDNVNPRRFSQTFVSLDDGYGKQPIPMVRGTWYFADGFYLTGLWIPFFRPLEFDATGTDWAIGGPMFPIQLLRRAVNRGGGDVDELFYLLDDVLPGWDDFLERKSDTIDDIFRRGEEPREDDLANCEAGGRVGGYFWIMDFALSYLYAWDDFPTLHINPNFLELGEDLSEPWENLGDLLRTDVESLFPLFRVVYHRVHTMGLELGIAPGGFSIRGEAAYTVGRYTYRDDLRPDRRDVLTWSASVEYTFEGDWIVQGQYYQTVYPTWDGHLLGERVTQMAGVIVRKTFLRDTIEFYGGAIYDFTHVGDDKVGGEKLWEQDWLILPMLTYKITDALHLRAGATLFGGDRFSTLGYLRDNSQVFARREVQFLAGC